jgi:hypothetical protein
MTAAIATKTVDAAVRPADGPGEFEMVLSDDSLDRDGEHLWTHEWRDPLPDVIPIKANHSRDIADIVGSGRPYIDSDGSLRVRGTFASTPPAQHVRTLVTEGHLGSVSVEFLRHPDGTAELVGGAFVDIPSNPAARVLAAKSYQSQSSGDPTMTTQPDGGAADNASIAEMKLKQLESDFGAKALRGECSEDEADRYTQEWEALDTQIKTERRAKQFASCASPAEHGREHTNPGDLDAGTPFRGTMPGTGNRIAPVSLYQIDATQIKALRQAALQGTPFRVTVGAKGIEHGMLGGGVRSKAAVTAGGLTPNLLPPIQQPGDRGYWGLPYELTRVANFLPNVGMDGPGIAYFMHTANAVEAGYTAEADLKPDLTPTITEIYVRPAKAAGRVNLTKELVADAGDAFANNLVGDLARSVYNAESNLLLNGTTDANGFNGINQVPGTLTRVANPVEDVDALDTLSRAFVDLRSDFFVPDVVFMHPATLGAIRRLRDGNGRLQLELLEGPRRIDQTSETESLWGVQVVQTTQQAPGTAAVLSVASGAAIVYVREALTTFFDPYSQAASNIHQYIAESRLALSTPHVGAICLISGLETGLFDGS